MKKVILFFSILSFLSCRSQDLDIFELTKQKNPPLVKIQEAVEYNLENARLYESRKIQIPYPFRYSYFSEKARIRLLELFEDKWTEKEIESQLIPKIKRLEDTLGSAKGFYKQVKKIALKDSLPVSRVWDSLILKRKNEYKSIITGNKISIRLVMKAAYIKDDRFVPFIKELLQDKEYGNQEELKLALARYGIEPYHKEMIESNSYNVFQKTPNPLDLYEVYSSSSKNLSFICSKDSFDELLKFVDTKERVYKPSIGDYAGFIAEFPIRYLSWLLKNQNLRKELSEIKGDMATSVENLEKSRELIKKYFANYTIDDMDCEKTAINLAW